MEKNPNGIELKKGEIVRVTTGRDNDETALFEVEKDNQFNEDFGCWGSVWLVGRYPPVWTHKGGIEKVK